MALMAFITGSAVASVVPDAGQQQQQQQQWVVLKQWTGEPGNLDTERFKTTAASFRVAWKTTDRGRGGVLDIYVKDGEGKLVKAAISLQTSDPTKEKGTASGTFTVGSQAGEYFLEIRSTGRDWQVAVEQPAQ
jgi:hypothetical protein